MHLVLVTSVKIWSTESGEVVRTLNGHSAVYMSVSFSPDGKYVVSGSGDESVKIWSTESGLLRPLSWKDLKYQYLGGDEI